MIVRRRSLKTESEKKKPIKPAEEKPTPLNMDKVVACKRIKMNKPEQEEIEFELDSNKKVKIPLENILKQECDVLKKIYTRLNRNYHPSKEASHEILNYITKVREEVGKEQPLKK